MGQVCAQKCQRINSINYQSTILNENEVLSQKNDCSSVLRESLKISKRKTDCIKPGSILRYPFSLNYIDNDSLDLEDEELNNSIFFSQGRFSNSDLDKQARSSLKHLHSASFNNSFNEQSQQRPQTQNSTVRSYILNNDFRLMIQNQQRELIDYQFIKNSSPSIFQQQLIKYSEQRRMIPSERTERKRSYEQRRQQQNRENLQLTKKSPFYYQQKLGSNQNSEQCSQNSSIPLKKSSTQRKDDEWSINSLVNQQARPSLAVDLNQNSELFTLKSRERQKTYTFKGILKNKTLNNKEHRTIGIRKDHHVRFTQIQGK